MYWALPLLILPYIFHLVDPTKLWNSLLHTDPSLAVPALLLYPATTLCGAIRWHSLMQDYYGFSLPRAYMVRHYWMGLVSSLFTPGSLGLDVYRVLIVGRRFGRYGLSIAAILVEKVAALFCCMGIVVVAYPFVVPSASTDTLENILILAHAMFLAIATVGLATLVIQRNTLAERLARSAENQLRRSVSKLLSRLRLPAFAATRTLTLAQVLSPLTRPATLLRLLGLSICIQLGSAVAVHLLFIATAYHVPLAVNLFLVPLLFFLLQLPITVAGLGVREGAFLLLYGLFGVPGETALLVSFFSMAGYLLSNALGTLLLLARKRVG
jgi:uncharacterized protein (TIRG00374 family)